MEPFAHPSFSYRWAALEDVGDVGARPEVIVHLAAQGDVDLGFTSPTFTAIRNIQTTIAVLEAARRWQPPLVLYASSAHAMEQNVVLGQAGLTETQDLHPGTPYGFSKAAGEMACWTWYRCYGVPVSVMSNGIVAGPGMRREHVLWKWLTALYRGDPVVLEGGAQTRDLTYVDDVLDAWLLAIEAPRATVVGEKFQVSYGVETSMEALLQMCFEVTGVRVSVMHRPYRPGEEGMRECFDISKAKSVLGYQPRYDPYLTIFKTWEYVQQEMAKIGVAAAVAALA